MGVNYCLSFEQANALLPPECSSHTHCVPMLVNTASLFEVTNQERRWGFEISVITQVLEQSTFLYLVIQGTHVSTTQATCSLLFSPHEGSH